MGPAATRIRGRSTFRALARPARRGRSGPVLVSFTPSAAGTTPQVGYAIGRRHGNAVRRNRLRRRLRACVREAVETTVPVLPPGAYLVSADPAAAGLSSTELCRRVREALEKAGDRPGRAPTVPPAAGGGGPDGGRGRMRPQALKGTRR